MTRESILARLSYNPKTGIFIHMDGPRKGEHVTSQVLVINGAARLLRRVAWFLLHGETPDNVIHANGDKSDFRESNLLNATSEQLAVSANQAPGRSGVRGVAYVSRIGKWEVRLRKNKRKYFFGYFDSLQEAIPVAIEARAQLHREFSRLSFRRDIPPPLPPKTLDKGRRLTEGQVTAIRLASEGKYGEATSLAKTFGVTPLMIGKIIRGTSWKPKPDA